MRKRVFVLFVEPMLYGLDLIREVYEKSGFQMQYYYCNIGLTGRDHLQLPKGAVVGQGGKKQRKQILYQLLDTFDPDYCVINGYTGVDQIIAIHYCIQHKIPYGIDSDTPLHIPQNPVLALVKKVYLHAILHHPFCYGIPGGTLQRENFLYYGIPEERIFIRPMSVSEERIQREYQRLPERNSLKEKYGVKGKTTFLFVGRLEAEKNVPILIEAYAKLKMLNDDIALIIVGDGALREELQEQARMTGAENIQFVGYQVFPGLIEFYKVADVFVLPSRFEPWGLVVNEAMTCGVPCIVSSQVGCRLDLIREGQTGFVFKSEDVASLTECMMKAISGNLRMMENSCLDRMEEWNFKVYLPEFKKRILEICEKYR